MKQGSHSTDVYYDVEKLRQDVMSHRIIVLNISGNEFCKICKVGRHTISNIENRNPIGLATLMKVCRGINKNYIDYLKQ